MKLIIFTVLLFSFSTFAADTTFECKTLLSGNSNGKAYTTAKSVDLVVKIDVEGQDADVRGTMVTKAGQYNRENDTDPVWAYFTDGRKFNKNGDVIKISSFDRNLLMCGMTQSPCRHWEEMTFNLKTLEGVLEKSHSSKAYFGEQTYSQSLKFSCKKI